MGMKISDVDILRLLPVFMQDYEANAALSRAINNLIRAPASRIKELRVWDQIDNLDHPALDELAWELNIYWYSVDMTLYQKRQAIRHGPRIQSKLGTKWAVEYMMSRLYDTDFKVSEWFEYGGEPFFFRIVTDLIYTGDGESQFLQHKELIALVFKLKNVRSWLEYIMFIKPTDPTPLVVSGLNEHSVTHHTHPGDRDITQQHTATDTPIIPAGQTKHSVRHTVTPQGRDNTRAHGTDAVPLFPGGTAQHSITHTSLPQERKAAEVFFVADATGTLPGGKLQHTAKHSSNPGARAPFYAAGIFEIQGIGAELALFVVDGELVQGYFQITETEES